MSPRPPHPNSQILDEAAEWFIELEGEPVDLPTRQAFDAWLRRSPEHVQAFLELLPIWEQGAAMARPRVDAESLIARVLDARGNVVPFAAGETVWAPIVPIHTTSEHADSATTTEVGGATEGPAPGARTQLSTRSFAAAAALAMLSLVGLLTWMVLTAGETYSTRLAEQRSVVLDDGSSVQLNTRSKIRVHFTEHERRIELLEGQALFDVAKDAARPFIVRSDDVSVRAVGTQFDVYRRRSGTIVTVLEGQVAVLPLNSGAVSEAAQPHEVRLDSGGGSDARSTVDARSILLAAGQQSVSTPGSIGEPAPANVASATAWTQRRLMFQQTTLAEVVEQFNRYNKRPLLIEDEPIGDFVVSGTFSSTDPEPLLRFLRNQPGMRVIESDQRVRIVAASDDPDQSPLSTVP